MNNPHFILVKCLNTYTGFEEQHFLDKILTNHLQKDLMLLTVDWRKC